MSRGVHVVGVGVTEFDAPGRRPGRDYPAMAKEAADAALVDARVPYDEIEQVAVGHAYGATTSGQRAVSSLGLTGVPVYNVGNGDATGSSALLVAGQLVGGGICDIALALGFDTTPRGSSAALWTDRADPLDHHLEVMAALYPSSSAPRAAQMFGNAGLEHMERYGTTAEQFALVAEKNHQHSKGNPRARQRRACTLAEVLASPVVHRPLTELQCAPAVDGAAAAVVMSECAVRKHGLDTQAVEIAGQALVTDLPSTFHPRSAIAVIGAETSREAAMRAFTTSGLGPEDMQVIELHDSFSTSEVITYEALGLCPEGQGGKLVEEGATTYGGQWVVNPSGGMLSRGHAPGATGVAQCAELTWQLRGLAGARQVPDVTAALQHDLSVGGGAVAIVYRKSGPCC